jgi:hypothetical protein
MGGGSSVEHLGNAGVLQSSEDGALAFEARLGVGAETRQEDLDCHPASERWVFEGFPDDPESTLAKHPEQGVLGDSVSRGFVTDGLARRVGGFLGCVISHWFPQAECTRKA